MTRRLALTVLLLAPMLFLPALARGQTDLPPEDEASGRLTVPDGFAIRAFISGLAEPRMMAIGPDGALYVAERGAGAVVRLPDEDGDGLADERQVVADGYDAVHGLEWADDTLYVADTGRIERLTDDNDDGDMTGDGERDLVTDNIPAGGQHYSRTVHVGPDGMLYVAVGSDGNDQPEEDPRRAAILRFNPDGSIPEDNPYVAEADERWHPVWAIGLRNSVDFLFLDDGRMWANHNGTDTRGDHLPPEEIVIEVEGGSHHGWPYCYTAEEGAVPADAAEVRDEAVAMDGPLSDCADAIPARFTDIAHQAPLGMDLADGDAFPEGFRGNLFVAYHGSWNSGVPRDCRVQMIVIEDGQPVSAEPFVTGFRDGDGQDCGDAWGRPAAVVAGPNGELFVSDDQNGNIYRVVAT